LSKIDFYGNLKKLFNALTSEGVMFFSLKTGSGERRDTLGRYYSYYTEEEVLNLIKKIGLIPLKQTKGVSRGLENKMEDWGGFFCIKN
jgi:hypothetical protein